MDWSSLGWQATWPEIIVAITALVVLGLDLIITSEQKNQLLAWATAFGALGALFALFTITPTADDVHLPYAYLGMIASDTLFVYFSTIFLFVTAAVALLSPAYLESKEILHKGEYYILLLMATEGMMILAGATNLMTIFLGIELLSLALYVLCGYIVRRGKSQEAGLKYFFLSSFASAFLLYGMSLVYGATGTTYLGQNISTPDPDLANKGQMLTRHGLAYLLDGAHAAQFMAHGPWQILLIGIILMAIGFAFKVSAVPFHMWTPDVYQGAPTPITAFMSICTKAAAFAAFIRVFHIAFASLSDQWYPLIWWLAVITMIGGNILAVAQRDVKRLLAYSSVAHAGYLLVALSVKSDSGRASLLFYLLVYAVMNMGAFATVMAVEREGGEGTKIEDFQGLGARQPILAAVMTIFLLSLAGLPPTGGFLAKFYVFSATINAGHPELAIIGVITSVVAAFYYLKIVVAMWFSAERPHHVIQPTPTIWMVTLVAAFMVILMGTFLPEAPLNWASGAAHDLVPTIMKINGR